MTWVLLMGNVREKEKGLWEKGENERERERDPKQKLQPFIILFWK